MTDPRYKAFAALDPFFDIVQLGLAGQVDGNHYFDAIAENAVFEYPPEDAPLSWHLSPNDGKQIETIWASAATASSREDVRNFLAAPPPATVSSAACQ